jgi:hypothetical protein
VEAHEVRTQESSEQSVSFRKGAEQLFGRKRYMKEEPDSSFGQPLSQELRKEEKLVIVNPDEIAFPIVFGHNVREPLVDLDIRLPVPDMERDLVQQIMEEGPEDAVGEPFVIPRHLGSGERHLH